MTYGHGEVHAKPSSDGRTGAQTRLRYSHLGDLRPTPVCRDHRSL